jgi:hypothetical protein
MRIPSTPMRSLASFRHLFVALACLIAACGTDSTTPGTDAGTSNSGTTVDPNDRDGDGIPNEEEETLGTDPDVADSDGDGRLDGSEVALKTDPTQADAVCVEDRYSAEYSYRPVDVIFAIDNSGSMRDEIDSIERNINENFADIVEEAGVDFRVIVISRHGEGGPFDSDVCVSSPLSGTNCDPVPDAPANTERFYHLDVEVSSDNAFERILSTYSGGWSQWLRDDTYKTFVLFTDDESKTEIGGEAPTAENFERQLLEMGSGHFGVAGSRNYVFHSIVGVGPKEDGEPYEPDEPVVNTQCMTAEARSYAYQQLSIATSGLRYPVCDFESYDAVFREVATGIIEDGQIDCSMRLPSVGEDQALDTERMALEFTAEEGESTAVITRVDGESSCGEDNFFLTDTTIELCPGLCERATNSETGELVVFAACDVRTCDNPRTEICDDGVDNDCDGFADRRDLQCIL